LGRSAASSSSRACRSPPWARRSKSCKWDSSMPLLWRRKCPAGAGKIREMDVPSAGRSPVDATAADGALTGPPDAHNRVRRRSSSTAAARLRTQIPSPLTSWGTDPGPPRTPQSRSLQRRRVRFRGWGSGCWRADGLVPPVGAGPSQFDSRHSPQQVRGRGGGAESHAALSKQCQAPLPLSERQFLGKGSAAAARLYLILR
jgi:hypothetical protein